MLAIHDTRVCTLQASIDVPEVAWRVNRNAIVVGADCTSTALSSCTQKTIHHLTDDCSITPVTIHSGP